MTVDKDKGRVTKNVQGGGDGGAFAANGGGGRTVLALK